MGKDRLTEQIKHIVELSNSSSVAGEFTQRIETSEHLTRDEDPQTHFCVYFAGFDPEAGEVFVGHHKKSDLWLFNGGHIDEGETPNETLLRELGEEWGLEMKLEDIGEPKLLTITEIDNPLKQTCRKHYDIWYFVPVKKSDFTPDEMLLGKEFHRTKWLTTKMAREVITDPNTLEAISLFEDTFSGNQQEM